jgi:hypothetical protein
MRTACQACQVGSFSSFFKNHTRTAGPRSYAQEAVFKRPLSGLYVTDLAGKLPLPYIKPAIICPPSKSCGKLVMSNRRQKTINLAVVQALYVICFMHYYATSLHTGTTTST